MGLKKQLEQYVENEMNFEKFMKEKLGIRVTNDHHYFDDNVMFENYYVNVLGQEHVTMRVLCKLCHDEIYAAFCVRSAREALMHINNIKSENCKECLRG